MSCLMSRWTPRSAVLEPPIRLAGRKGRSGGTRSEAEMGPASIEESRSRQGGEDGGDVFVGRAGLCFVVEIGSGIG
jgi:hypothetical protein